MGSNEGRVWVSLGGVGHVEPSEGFFGLTFITKPNFPIRLLKNSLSFCGKIKI